MTDFNVFEQMIYGVAGIPEPSKKYLCIKCKKEMTHVPFTPGTTNQKMFYCSDNKCEKFGMITVVAIQKKK